LIVVTVPCYAIAATTVQKGVPVSFFACIGKLCFPLFVVLTMVFYGDDTASFQCNSQAVDCNFCIPIAEILVINVVLPAPQAGSQIVALFSAKTYATALHQLVDCSFHFSSCHFAVLIGYFHLLWCCHWYHHCSCYIVVVIAIEIAFFITVLGIWTLAFWLPFGAVIVSSLSLQFLFLPFLLSWLLLFLLTSSWNSAS